MGAHHLILSKYQDKPGGSQKGHPDIHACDWIFIFPFPASFFFFDIMPRELAFLFN